MKKHVFRCALLAISLLWATTGQAFDFNLINIDMDSPQNPALNQMYGDAYGFPPHQVAPALMAPSQEVPAILQVAKAAGTLPAGIWMMRQMGMSYSNILQTFSVAPAAVLGSGLTPSFPGWFAPGYGGYADSFYVERLRHGFLTNNLGVNPSLIPLIPYQGVAFHRALLNPVIPGHGVWLPPGIAKKYGLWVPPGQAKKWGGDWKDWDHDGKHWHHGKRGKHHHKHGHHHGDFHDDDNFKGKGDKKGREHAKGGSDVSSHGKGKDKGGNGNGGGGGYSKGGGGGKGGGKGKGK